MYRRLPQKSTPSNVQCQKCLKRGHYSYECKSSTQERPYVSRPSRTQQLLNPKLAPKLSTETVDSLQNKKGVADEALAKREAERAKEQAREDEEDKALERLRRRSSSLDSASTNPPRATRSPSPRREETRSPSLVSHGRSRSHSPVRDPSRRERSHSSDEDRGYRSPSPAGKQPRRSISPRRNSSPRRYRDREPTDFQSREKARRYSSGSNKSLEPHPHRRRHPSRSPERPTTRDWRGDRGPGPSREPDAGRNRKPERRREEPRERSLSPFSKRLRMTQAMGNER